VVLILADSKGLGTHYSGGRKLLQTLILIWIWKMMLKEWRLEIGDMCLKALLFTLKTVNIF
jgi:hypothetical protein